MARNVEYKIGLADTKDNVKFIKDTAEKYNLSYAGYARLLLLNFIDSELSKDWYDNKNKKIAQALRDKVTINLKNFNPKLHNTGKKLGRPRKPGIKEFIQAKIDNLSIEQNSDKI